MPQGIFDNIAESIKTDSENPEARSAFHMFEPWDVEERPQWIKDQMRMDSIDLYHEEMSKHIAPDPHPFQTGYLMSKSFLRSILSGSQVGKSHVAFIEIVIACSGVIPYSLRFPKGFDTGIKRLINADNIRRFGRFNAKTGEFIDKLQARPTPDWDCGTIKGAGQYPVEKIAPPGSQIWIGTYQKAELAFWWPMFTASDKIIPDSFLDRTRAENGVNQTNRHIFMPRGCTVMLISYEAGYKRFEAKRAWMTILDEEPPDSRILQSAQTHCNFLSLVETPYAGITWTKDILFPKTRTPDSVLFHATQYDSPYQTPELIAKSRSIMQPWDIKARVWGLLSDTKGEPYFDRMKLMTWRERLTKPFKWMQFSPSRQYEGIVSRPEVTHIPGLMDVNINTSEVEQDDEQKTWRVYEEPRAGVPYVFLADPAEGAATVDAAGDYSAALIMRPPIGKETHPQIVASMRSTLEAVAFSRYCMFGIILYNNAVLAAETKRGRASATFWTELRTYPHWFQYVSIQDSTGRARAQDGWDTNSATRDTIFDLIADHINSFDVDEYPQIPDEPLLSELAAAVVVVTSGGKKKCDHPSNGTLDTTICYGIGLWIFKHGMDQVQCHKHKTGQVKRRNRHDAEEKIFCGLKHLGMKT